MICLLFIYERVTESFTKQILFTNYYYYLFFWVLKLEQKKEKLQKDLFI